MVNPPSPLRSNDTPAWCTRCATKATNPATAMPPSRNNPSTMTSTHTIGLVLRAAGGTPGAPGCAYGAVAAGGYGAAGWGVGAAAPGAGVPHWLQKAPVTLAPHMVQKGIGLLTSAPVYDRPGSC